LESAWFHFNQPLSLSYKVKNRFHQSAARKLNLCRRYVEGGPEIQLQDAIIFAKDYNKLLDLVGRDGDLMPRHFTHANIGTALIRFCAYVRQVPVGLRTAVYSCVQVEFCVTLSLKPPGFINP
jgi:hypothetical protein